MAVLSSPTPITIVDYGTGNLASIANMLRHIGVPAEISSDPAQVRKARRLILPGVGHFDFGMTALRSSGLLDALNDRVQGDGIPVLGICLGAQLLTRRSDEGNLPGLGWIQAETVSFSRGRLGPNLRIPHMGWSDTTFSPKEPLFKGAEASPRFYYVHSFHLACDKPENEICWGHHGYRFTAGIRSGHVCGVQFHPEKSHQFGMQLLRSFSASTESPQ